MTLIQDAHTSLEKALKKGQILKFLIIWSPWLLRLCSLESNAWQSQVSSWRWVMWIVVGVCVKNICMCDCTGYQEKTGHSVCQPASAWSREQFFKEAAFSGFISYGLPKELTAITKLFLTKYMDKYSSMNSQKSCIGLWSTTDAFCQMMILWELYLGPFWLNRVVPAIYRQDLLLEFSAVESAVFPNHLLNALILEERRIDLQWCRFIWGIWLGM